MKVRDQLGRELDLPKPVTRIVSLVPSQTELLFSFGLGDRIIGVTHFCIHPSKDVKQKEKIGGTKKLNIEKIRALQPDLIIANKEENEETQIKELEKDFPVWISDVSDINSALEMIRAVASICGVTQEGISMTEAIAAGFAKLQPGKKRKTLYLIWRNPWMAAGKRTFIDSVMSCCGFQNVMTENRYPQLADEHIGRLSPELVLLSSEPYPFRQKHIGELKALCPEADVELVDGEMFSWYGSRMVEMPHYLGELINADL